jgi:hypothetical protein
MERLAQRLLLVIQSVYVAQEARVRACFGVCSTTSMHSLARSPTSADCGLMSSATIPAHSRPIDNAGSWTAGYFVMEDDFSGAVVRAGT